MQQRQTINGASERMRVFTLNQDNQKFIYMDREQPQLKKFIVFFNLGMFI